MTAKELLVNLLKEIVSLSESEYEQLCDITESHDFVSLSERQVRFWLEWEKKTAA